MRDKIKNDKNLTKEQRKNKELKVEGPS